MMAKLNEQAAFTLFLLAFVGLLFYSTMGLDHVARLVPMRVVIPTFAMLAVQLLLDLNPSLAQWISSSEKTDLLGVTRLRGRAGGEMASAAGGRNREERRALLWVLLLLVFIYLLGFPIAVPLYTLLYLKKRAEEGWVLSLGITVTLSSLVYAVFALVLPTRLYSGELWIWFSP